MFIKKPRSQTCLRRYLFIICCVSFWNILLIAVRINQPQFEADDGDQERPAYCSQSMIRRFYMHDLNPGELFARDPIRSSFTYQLSNKNFCSPIAPPHALIFVISKSVNFGARNAIRRTWGNLTHIVSFERSVHLRLKLLFLLDIDENALLSIELEQSIYHDLVQVHLPQHYILSTYRDMAMLHWTETYCAKVLLTIKTDDDIFLNIFLLANFLSRIMSNLTSDPTEMECKSVGNYDPLAVIYGLPIQDAKVVRHSNNRAPEENRYITTGDEYPCRHYPTYMSGFGYIITRRARVKLLCAFFREEKLFYISDVYITGILSEYMNIHRRNLPFRISYASTDDCDKFFTRNNAFACASALHYRKQSSPLRDADIFERFNVYWTRVYHNRIPSLHRVIRYS